MFNLDYSNFVCAELSQNAIEITDYPFDMESFRTLLI